PVLEAAKWLAAVKVCNVLPTPSPNREQCGQEFGATLVDFVEKSRSKRSRLGVFAVGIKLAIDESTSEVFTYSQTVASDGDEGRAVQRHHLRLTEQANSGGALGQYRRKRIGAKRGSICVIQK